MVFFLVHYKRTEQNLYEISLFFTRWLTNVMSDNQKQQTSNRIIVKIVLVSKLKFYREISPLNIADQPHFAKRFLSDFPAWLVGKWQYELIEFCLMTWVLLNMRNKYYVLTFRWFNDKFHTLFITKK